MEPRSNNPDAHGPWSEELPDLLRAAVGQLRDEPPPPDACARALERARQLATPPRQPRPWPTSRISLLVTGAVAASLLTYLAWPGSDPVVAQRDGRDPNGRVQPPVASVHRDRLPAVYA